MRWWNSFWRRAPADAELETLRAEVQELRERLAFVNQKHEHLVAQEGVPMQENAVLRFDLQRCQRDRLVLEAHLASARGALRMARAVPRAKVAPSPEFEAGLIDEVTRLLDSLEGWRDAALRAEPKLAEGLARLDPRVEALHAALLGLQGALIPEGSSETSG